MKREAVRCLGLAAMLGMAAAAGAQERSVYRCPGNLYTDQISAKEAMERGCKTLDGAPITVIQGPRRPAAPVAAAAAANPASRVEARVDPSAQRQRDTDARRILEAELRKEEDRLAELQKAYNGGSPERRGDEQNYARYQERVAEMKAAIGRKEADVAAIRRELAKLSAASEPR